MIFRNLLTQLSSLLLAFFLAIFVWGVATNEETREGINEWKRNRLIQAGADIIVGDFREADKLLEILGI